MVLILYVCVCVCVPGTKAGHHPQNQCSQKNNWMQWKGIRCKARGHGFSALLPPSCVTGQETKKAGRVSRAPSHIAPYCRARKVTVHKFRLNCTHSEWSFNCFFFFSFFKPIFGRGNTHPKDKILNLCKKQYILNKSTPLSSVT